jgi:hypothetical protein
MTRAHGPQQNVKGIHASARFRWSDLTGKGLSLVAWATRSRTTFGATPSFRKGKMKVLISILWLFLVLGGCVGQVNNNSTAKTRPNLSGVWVLDNSRSKITDKVVDYVLTIIHKEPEIKMTKKYKHDNREHLEEVIFYTDGQPEFNSKKGARDPEPVTRWHGNKLVRRSTNCGNRYPYSNVPAYANCNHRRVGTFI